jgi:hypothetical protein
MKDRKVPDNKPDSDEAGMENRLTSKKPKGQAALGREIQAKIGQQLRAYYDSLLEPAPDRFNDLLQKLEQSGGKEEPSE